MILLDHALGRIRSCLAEIRRLKEGDFPYRHSREALDRLADLFSRHEERLTRLDADNDIEAVKLACALSLRDLFIYLPLVGFVLRSTNVRNAFEVYGPLWRLARTLLDKESGKRGYGTHLLISSEWDYSPFVYTNVPELPDFVLIGFPACESSNPLLLPLAGHEIGHAVWRDRNWADLVRLIADETLRILYNRWDEACKAYPFLPPLSKDPAVQLPILQPWASARDWAGSQAEESFCDFVGLRLFGTAYLHAFAYLLSPGKEPRSGFYPCMYTRVSNLVMAAERFAVPAPPDYLTLFEMSKVNKGWDAAHIFILSVADEALRGLTEELMNRTKEVVPDQGDVVLPTDQETQRVLSRLRLAVPAEGSASLADILNAAWEAHLDPTLWSEIYPHLAAQKEQALPELVLKNIEVFEIERIVRGS